VRLSGNFLVDVWRPLVEANPDTLVTQLLKEAISIRALAQTTEATFEANGEKTSAKDFLWEELLKSPTYR